MAARASFSHESRMVKMPLRSSVLLKDYLLDDLSSCSSNGFRSYPRRQCCTKVRYLIEIDLNKHVKLPQTNKHVRRNKSKPKLKLKASLVNVFKSFKLSSIGSDSGGGKKTKFLPRNLSLKLSMHGLWKRSTNQEKKELKKLNSFDESIKCKENILPSVATIATEKSNSNSISNSNNSPTSSDSCFTITSNSSTTCGYSKTNVAQNKTKENKPFGAEKMNAANEENVATKATTISPTDNAKDLNPTEDKFQAAQKNEFSPISVIEFPSDNDNDDEDEVTSPFQHNSFYAKGCKRKLKSKVQRTKSFAQLNPVRLEDRITLSESGTQGTPLLESSLQTQQQFVAEKRALALLQLLKATMSSHDLSESPMTERVLLGYFIERFIDRNFSNYIILQEAKDWINGQTKEIFEFQNNKVTYIKEMEKGAMWLNYNEEETREVVSELEFEVFTSLVEEILLEFYL
ncbi:uncharacterized protein LOC143616633 [Bidens hawaiensis]|uniref:uncharacterized protein LOC143616633 n=1 Tax=Bidens hawaiensis TaxID=980011 RepID=UPI004048FEA9